MPSQHCQVEEALTSFRALLTSSYFHFRAHLCPFVPLSEAWLLEALGSDAVDEIVTEAAGLTVGIVCLSMAFAAT